jgi:hypothetical protein
MWKCLLSTREHGLKVMLEVETMSRPKVLAAVTRNDKSVEIPYRR